MARQFQIYARKNLMCLPRYRREIGYRTHFAVPLDIRHDFLLLGVAISGPSGWLETPALADTRTAQAARKNVSSTNGPAPKGDTGTPMASCWAWAEKRAANNAGIMNQCGVATSASV
jgi:hypothetical protein